MGWRGSSGRAQRNGSSPWGDAPSVRPRCTRARSAPASTRARGGGGGARDVSRAVIKEDGGNEAPRRNYGVPAKGDPDVDRAAADALLEAARAGETASAEQATGYYWGEPRLREHVRRILDRARAAGDERLEQLAERFLS